MTPRYHGTSTIVKLSVEPKSSTVVLMNLDEIIQRNVKRFRKEAGLTQQKLADRAEVSVDGVRKWESGRGTPDRESITKLAAALGRKMDDFNQENPPPASTPSLPAFTLKVSDGTPDDLRQYVQDFVNRMNQEAVSRGMAYPPGVRRARGTTDPLATIRTTDAARREDRQEQPAAKAERASGQKRQRR